MTPRSIALCLPLLLSGCAAHRWSHPSVTDPLQVDQDTYACMKENSYVAGQVDSDRHGVRASEVTKVDQQLFQACMRARGYTWVKVEKPAPTRPPYLSRPARSRGVVLEAETALGGVWSSDRWVYADFTAMRSDMDAEPDVRSAMGLSTVFTPSLRIGAVVRPWKSVDLGGRVGLHSTRGSTYSECIGAELSMDGDACDTDTFESALGVDAAVIARFRPGAAPRLFAATEVGVTNVAGAPAIGSRVNVHNFDTDEDGVTSLEVGEEPPVLVPYLRAGAGLDLLHPDPLGLALGCSADIALRPAALIGDPWSSQQWTVDCALTLRLSPSRMAPAP